MMLKGCHQTATALANRAQLVLPLTAPMHEGWVVHKKIVNALLVCVEKPDLQTDRG
jgi:hypothetical protein